MKWPFFTKKSPIDSERVDRYKHLRQIGRELNLTLIKQLPKAAMPECGKKLGIFKAGTLILNNDDEIAILYDYCLHHYRRGGKTFVERHLELSPPATDSSEMTVLQAMLKARFSVYRVDKITPTQGAILFDLLRGGTLDLMDIGLADTGTPGAILAGRLLPVSAFHMSSGSLIPVPEPVFVDKILPIADKFMPAAADGSRPPLSSAQEASFAAQVIRVALHQGGADNSFYTDMEV